MNIFTAIGNFFKNLFKAANLQKFESFVADVFTAEKAIALGYLKDVAMDAVTQVGSLATLTDPQKRAAAFTQIETYAKDKGIVVGESMINLALEMAVQAFKNGNQGVVTAPKV